MKFTQQQSWFIFLLWISVAIGCAIYLAHANKPFKIGTISAPGSESALAQKFMEQQLPFGGTRIFILYQHKTLTAKDPLFKAEVKQSLAGLKKLSLDYSVISPYDNAQQIATDQHAVYAVLAFSQPAEEIANHMNEIRHALGKPATVSLLIGGQPSYISDVYQLSEKNLIRAELIALPLAFIVMIFIFGGILAALLPIISAVISIVIIVTILYGLGNVFELTIFVLNIATMLGLGLCLDYTLLITYRYREEIDKVADCKIAIRKTLATAGRSIFFSGLTVLISIASLLFFHVNVLYSIGVGGIVVVIVAVLCSLTFLPALLCLIEKNLNAFSIPLLKPIATENIQHHGWYRFSLYVMKHPLLFLLPTMLFLLMLGYPFLHVKLNSSNAKILPTWMESRQLIDQFSKHFNKNELTPINIVFEAHNKSILTANNIGSLYDFTQQLKKDLRVQQVSNIVTLKPELTKKQYEHLYAQSHLPFNHYEKQLFQQTTQGKFTTMTVISKYSEENQHSFALVNHIRASTLHNQLSKQVTGSSAVVIDTIHVIYTLFFKVLIAISFITYLVLVLLLRSIFLPLKAILMNFFSLSVCYGMLVFIFQTGHFSHLLNFTPLGYTELDLPILLFFGLFGLSMDYEVFLLTRIKEFYDETGNNTESVALGLERSARIITSAALILVIVCGAFVTADILFIKAFGLGTALAIAVDASLIRLLLVPATMRLLGDWNWYLPKWLDRIMPHIRVE